jgi:hypothetical protein
VEDEAGLMTDYDHGDHICEPEMGKSGNLINAISRFSLLFQAIL